MSRLHRILILAVLVLLVGWVAHFFGPIEDLKDAPREYGNLDQPDEIASDPLPSLEESPPPGTGSPSGLTYYTEKVSDYHWKEVSIENYPGLPYPIRKEQILHQSSEGLPTVKSSVSYVANQLIIGLAGEAVPEALNELGFLKPIRSFLGNRSYILTFSDWDIDSVQKALVKLAEEPLASLLRYAEPDFLIQTYLSPDDPEFLEGNQWGLKNEAFQVDIRAELGWDIRTTAEDVVVAIIDTGIDTDHPDLVANLWKNPGEIPGNGLDDDSNGIVDDIFGLNAISGLGDVEDDNGHGTHVAGIAGAVGNNETGITGVAWNTNLMTVKFLNEEGRGVASDAIEAIYYAVDQGANIINASWGSFEYSSGLYDAVNYAADADVLFVAASGNTSFNIDSNGDYPSSFDLDNIISVGSIGRGGELSEFSNYGKSTVDIAAPGEDILSTVPFEDSAYFEFSGTSMAAPHVTGILVLLLQHYSGDPMAIQKERLFQGYRPLDSLDGKIRYAGIPDLGGSLGLAEPLSRFRFMETLPLEYIRFNGQSITLDVEVENPEDVSYHWYRNGYLIPGAIANSLTLENLRESNSGQYKVVAEKAGFSISDSTQLKIIVPSLPMKAAADTKLEIGTYLQQDWKTTAVTFAVGASSLVSSNPEDNSSSSLYSHVEGEGTLSFFWKVSSEANYDFLNFKVNGELSQRISGERDWGKVDIQLSGEGLKILEWEYKKDSAVAGNKDQAYLDGLSWFPVGYNIPVITEGPHGRVLSVGSMATFEVIASGTGLKYQWFKDGIELPGAVDSVFTIQAVSTADSGFYRVEVYNEFGSVRSAPVELKVGDFSVEILTHPANIQTREYVEVEFEVNGTGTEPLSYQWYKDGEILLNETDSKLIIPSVSFSNQGMYQVAVSNAFTADAVLSNSAALSIDYGLSGPRIIKVTQDLFVPKGRPARLEVIAVGSYPLRYQWYFEDGPLSGATSSVLEIPAVDESHIGAYYCEVYNEFGTVQSEDVEIFIVGNIGDAVEQPLLEWVTNHEAKVVTVSDPTYDGVDALRISGGLNEGPTSVQTTIEGPAEVSFWLFNDQTLFQNIGEFYLTIDGAVQNNLPAWVMDYGPVSFRIEEPGPHEISILVSSRGADANIYIDQVEVNHGPCYGSFCQVGFDARFFFVF
jgi:subtilisin family serine protease